MIGMVLAGLAFAGVSGQSWSPASLQAALARKEPIAAPELARWFGERDLETGAGVRIEDLVGAWAIRAPKATRAAVASIPPGRRFELTRIDETGLFVGAFTAREAEAFRWTYEVDGRAIGAVREFEAYTMPPESKADPKVPKGNLEKQAPVTSQVFGGTKHDWWIYTPAGFDAGVESNLMVVQDGQWSTGYVPVYFDHLIAKKEIPQTVVVFVTPGTFPDGKWDRSREYDSLGDAYVRFLLEELLPPVEAKYKITQDPMRRGVFGLSSGGICAFTAAWERPDKFGLVLSWIGSFTNIAAGATLREGGHNYPALVRKTLKKPIRVFLQEGENDLDNVHGSWPLANRAMEASLRFMGYDVKSVWGLGFHSDRQGRATLADALRWLYRKD